MKAAPMNIDELKQRLISLNGEAHQIRTTAEAEQRDLSVEETNRLDAVLSAFDRTKADTDRLEKLKAQSDLLTQPSGRRTEPEAPRQALRPGEDPEEPRTRRLSKNQDEIVPAQYQVGPKNGGFQSLGHMALAVRKACVEGGFTDPRLERLASATTFGSESSGADGGFAVPPDFRSDIMVLLMGEDSILSLCDQINTSSNNFTMPVDETTPWQTSGGILATWDGEAAAANQTKPQITERTIKLNKLRVLVPMTDEILDDASAMDSYLRKKAPQKIQFKMNFALIQGTGVGQPLGILNSPALVTVAKESGQQTGSIVAMNIMKMFNRMYGPNRSKAVWFYNQEVEPQLYKLSIPGTDNTGNFVTTWGISLFQPPGALSASPYGTIMGRPCFPTQACASLSTVGDIIFADMSQYLALLKSGPNPRVDISMHLWFDQDLMAYRFILRVGGVPWWSIPATPLAGSNTYSPYVCLATR